MTWIYSIHKCKLTPYHACKCSLSKQTGQARRRSPHAWSKEEPGTCQHEAHVRLWDDDTTQEQTTPLDLWSLSSKPNAPWATGHISLWLSLSNLMRHMRYSSDRVGQLAECPYRELHCIPHTQCHTQACRQKHPNGGTCRIFFYQLISHAWSMDANFPRYSPTN